MSYDVYMEMDSGNGHTATAADIGNCTYNLAPMFCEALGKEGLRGLDGRLGEEVADTVWKGLRDMVTRQSFYEEMNPANGWGDYEGAVEYIRKLAYECSRHPKATIRIG